MANPGSSKVVETAISEASKAIASLLSGDPKLRPQFIRIAFYDAISYDPITKVDGPNGSIRLCDDLTLDQEIKTTIRQLASLKEKGQSSVWSFVSYADLYQLAGILAVEKAEGPHIEFQYGRMDSYMPIAPSKLQNISEVQNLVDNFRRIGFTDKEIVALSLACYYWMNYTSDDKQPIINTSFYEKLLKLEDEAPKSKAASTSDTNKSATAISPLHSWKFLVSDASFRKHVELFVKEPKVIESEYAKAHKKLSELGFKNFPQRIPTATEYQDMKHGIAFAVAMTILFGFVGFFYEVMRA